MLTPEISHPFLLGCYLTAATTCCSSHLPGLGHNMGASSREFQLEVTENLQQVQPWHFLRLILCGVGASTQSPKGPEVPTMCWVSQKISAIFSHSPAGGASPTPYPGKPEKAEVGGSLEIGVGGRERFLSDATDQMAYLWTIPSFLVLGILLSNDVAHSLFIQHLILWTWKWHH